MSAVLQQACTAAEGQLSVSLLPPGGLLQSPAGSMTRGAKPTLQHLVAAMLAGSATQHAAMLAGSATQHAAMLAGSATQHAHDSQPERTGGEQGLPVAWHCLKGSYLAGSPSGAQL